MGRWLLTGALMILAVSLMVVQVSAEAGPSESECRPYIDKALHELKTHDESEEQVIDADVSIEVDNDNPSDSNVPDDNVSSEENEDSVTEEEDNNQDGSEEQTDTASAEVEEDKADDSAEDNEDEVKNIEKRSVQDEDNSREEANDEGSNEEVLEEEGGEEVDAHDDSGESDENAQNENTVDESEEGGQNDGEEAEEEEEAQVDDNDSAENEEVEAEAAEPVDDSEEAEEAEEEEVQEASEGAEDDDAEEPEEAADAGSDENDEEDVIVKREVSDAEATANGDVDDDSDEQEAAQEEEEEPTADDSEESIEIDATEFKDIEQPESEEELETETPELQEKQVVESDEDVEEPQTEEPAENESEEEDEAVQADAPAEEVEEEEEETEEVKAGEEEPAAEDNDADSDEAESTEEAEAKEVAEEHAETEEAEEAEEPAEEEEVSPQLSSALLTEAHPEDDLLLEYEIPENLRDRSHIAELLHFDKQSLDKETALNKVADVILRDLKRIYESAIKPLETLYKYRDLSNRHFGDPEIFSKPLILFMGPWSGGKSSILNYLTDNEYTPYSLRTGAEPSPAYFNILMHGDEPEVLDGTQLAADWTFSGLQKFGQGLEDRLRGLKLPSKILEKVNIVEIPGILEVRKQVSRVFPFNDACQWFIDRADIIFLVYDPSKLDVGPETEAILDQLKGREYQTRIVLNKADQVKPEELMRVQSALIWNISPLMSSAQPPVMYTVSLWSNPYETNAPMRLLQAQERTLLRDLRSSIDKRIDHKIASARRFAVRVRNHAKMVDCYLTTYYNHKTLFGNKKLISDQIIDHPQNYHIYEGLSTLTNISRYDLPDPEVYRDFFRLNPLYEFKKLSDTCTYFRGCPINKLDISIAYDFPELVGKYKKALEVAFNALDSEEPGRDAGNNKS